jgi:hypothetical protein
LSGLAFFFVYATVRKDLQRGVIMTKHTILFSISALFLFPALGIAQFTDGLVLVRTECDFEIQLNGSENPPEMYPSSHVGTGFFVGHQEDTSSPIVQRVERVVTAGHIASCEPWPNEFPDHTVLSFRRMGISIEYKGRLFIDVAIKKEFPSAGGADARDEALLEFSTQFSFSHEHFELLPRATEYQVGERIFVQGYFLFGILRGGERIWEPIMYEGFISRINIESFHFGVRAYNGLSGSPVFVERNGRHFVVGIVSHNDSGMYGEPINLSGASRIDIDFLNEE